ncbi:MAG: HAD hydrolase family protein [Planctomycetes bacterium]|nr:HAD hydrolase family protein [Planctomycetota bacterium]
MTFLIPRTILAHFAPECWPVNLDLISLIILDVDGVLTDGRLWSTPDGEWVKAFSSQDGFAIKAWQRGGGRTAILSGRADDNVSRRAKDLGIEIVHLGITDKLEAFADILTAVGCGNEAVCYVGDDFPDLGPMSRAAFPVAVANARAAVKRKAQYVTRTGGGCGALAELIELLLRKQGRWPGSLLD